MQYHVYILYSLTLDRYYIGMSSDPHGRLWRHNISRQGYTSKGQPWELVYSEVFETKPEAMSRERQLKGWKNRDRILTLIGNK